jgi:hypothetical protein
MGMRHPCRPFPRPHAAETKLIPLAHPWVDAMPAVDADMSRTSTDHLPTDHLAIELPCMPTTNSTGRRHLGPTLHRAVAMPLRHDRDAQRAQSVQRVPVYARPLQPRTAHTPARHRAPDAMPPLPCTATHRADRAVHHFSCIGSESARVAAKPASRRHCYSYP